MTHACVVFFSYFNFNASYEYFKTYKKFTNLKSLNFIRYQFTLNFKLTERDLMSIKFVMLRTCIKQKQIPHVGITSFKYILFITFKKNY